MTMNPLPPQAYTKDTLLKAYSWLQNQPNNIKEMASTPDVLVSLYLKATRDGEGALDRPSIQNFKNELKQLAGMMGELEAPAPPMAPSTSPLTSLMATNVNSAQRQGIPLETLASPSMNLTPNPAATHQPYQVHLDSKSWFMIQEVKETLNLSCDLEALRAVIKIGHTKVKSL